MAFRSKNGISLIELLMSLTALGLISAAAAKFFDFSGRVSKKMVQRQSNKVAFMEWETILSKRIRGALLLVPEERLNSGSTTPLYRGIHDVKYLSSKPRFCADNSDLSILRLTSTYVSQGGTKLLAAWEESCSVSSSESGFGTTDGCAANLRTLRVPFRATAAGPDAPTNPSMLFDNGIKSHDEIVLIDVDRVSSSRYQVLSVQKVNEEIPGVVDSNPHVTVVVSRASMLTGGSVPSIRQKFIAGSLLLPSVTEIICVDELGRLVHSAGTDKTPLPLVVPEGGKITEFKVGFLASKGKEPLEFSQFKDFSEASDINFHRCINYILVEMTVTLDGETNGKTMRKIFFLPQHHQSRIESCRA